MIKYQNGKALLNIFLGGKCNLRCAYCIQEDHTTPKTLMDTNLPEQIHKLVDRYQLDVIKYWGGEPFLYWDEIYNLQESLLSRGCKTRISIKSNGTLVTDEHVNVLNEWNAELSISMHQDALTQQKWDAIRKAKYTNICYLFTKKNPNFKPFYFYTKMLENELSRDLFASAAWVRATPGCSDEYRFDLQSLKEHLKHLQDLADECIEGKEMGDMFWRVPLVKSLIPGINSERHKTRCFGSRYWSIDLQGNRYACHHNVDPKWKIGSLTTPPTKDELNVLKFMKKHSCTSKCKGCTNSIKTDSELRCVGNCPFSETHELDCMLTHEVTRIIRYIKEKTNVI